MECPYCEVEMRYDDYYFKGRDTNNKIGDIYFCENSEGFEEEEVRDAYVEDNDIKIGEGLDFVDKEDVCCDSTSFNGYFGV